MVVLEIRVTPRSGRRELFLDAHGRLKAFVKSPPEGGKANKELIRFLAKQLSCPQSSVVLIKGASSRSKTIGIDTHLSYEGVLSRLGLAHQISLAG